MKRFAPILALLIVAVFASDGWSPPPSGGVGVGLPIRDIQDLRDVTKPLSAANGEGLIYGTSTNKFIATDLQTGAEATAAAAADDAAFYDSSESAIFTALDLSAGGITDTGPITGATTGSFSGDVTTANLDITSGAAGDIGLTIQGAVSQSANLQEWHDSSGDVLLAVQPNGDLFTDRWTGSETNTVIGVEAMGSNALTTSGGGNNGKQNTAIGEFAMQDITTGYRNVAVGSNALANIIGGSSNVAIGRNALLAHESGSNNLGMGTSALTANVSGSNNVAIGTGAGQGTTGGSNTAIGASAMLVGTSVNNNTVIGYQGMYFNTTGDGNTAIGYKAGRNLVTGDDNLAIGQEVAFVDTNASGQLVLGEGANVAISANTMGTDLTLHGAVSVPDGINSPAYTGTWVGEQIAAGYLASPVDTNYLDDYLNIPAPIFWAPFDDPDDPLKTYVGGPLTFVRATTGTYLHPATSFVTTASVGQLRIEETGALIEGQRTNSLLRSRDFDTSPWTWPSGTPGLTQDQVGIDGDNNVAWTVEDDITDGNERLNQNVSILNDGNTHAYSVFIAKDNDETRFPAVALRLINGTSQFIYLQINTKTGASTITSSTGTVTGEVVDFNATWWRVVVTVQNNTSGNNLVALEVFPAHGSTFGAPDNTVTGSIVIDGAQLEKNVSFASSVIFTTSAAVTRNMDLLKFANDGINGAEGTMLVDLNLNSLLTGNNQGVVAFQPAGNGELLQWRESDHVLYMHDGTNIRHFMTNTIDDTSTHKLGTRWGNSVMSLLTDGGVVSSLGFDGDINIGDNGILGNHGDGSSYPLYGHIQDLRIWDSALTDAEMVYLTTYDMDSAWQPLNEHLTDLAQGPSYASIYATNKTITITTASVYYLATDDWTQDHANGPSYNGTTGTFEFVTADAGIYEFGYSISATASGGDALQCHLDIEGEEHPEGASHIDMAANAASAIMSASGFITIIDGDSVLVHCANDSGTTNIVLATATFHLHRIGP